MSKQKNVVDMVYTWVDGANPYLIEQSKRYTKNKKDLNPERTRDIYELLRFSLRSVEQFVPWINRIFIVTMRPLVPQWLNLSHPKISLVHHDEIFENLNYLPTFNCHAIESYLHRIPNLSEHFIYMNDDYLFGNYADYYDFFDKDSRIKIFGTYMGETVPVTHNNWRNFAVSKLQHTPMLYKKSYCEEMLDAWHEDAVFTRQQRFRTRQDLMLHGLHRYFMLTRKREFATAVPVWQYRKFYTFHKITNDYSKQRNAFRRLARKRPLFYCLNDDQRDHPNPDVVKLVSTFLSNYYPKESGYELT